MKDKQENFFKPQHLSRMNATTTALIYSFALYQLLRKGGYRIALITYRDRGSLGFNIYKDSGGGYKRRFAIDYHPFWDKVSKEKIWRLHYHRGETFKEIRKHRPYEGL